MVDVQKRALGPLKEEPLAGLASIQQERRGIAHKRLQTLGIAEVVALVVAAVRGAAVTT